MTLDRGQLEADLDALDAAAAAVVAHAQFPGAQARLCASARLADPPRAADTALADNGRVALAALIFALEHAADQGAPPPTASGLQRLMAPTGIASTSRLRAMLATFEHQGLVILTPSPLDRRVRTVSPTAALRERFHVWLGEMFAAVHEVRPLPIAPQTLAARRDIMGGFFARSIGAIAGGFRLYRGLDAIRDLTHRASGHQLLLILAELAPPGGGLRPLPPQDALARRLNVTRGQVVKLLRQAEADGWVLRQPRQPGGVVLAPAFVPELRRFIGREIAWTASLAHELAQG